MFSASTARTASAAGDDLRALVRPQRGQEEVGLPAGRRITAQRR